MENLEKLESIIGKFPGQNWKFYAKKLGWSKSKFYDYTPTLQLQNKIYSKNGFWYPSTEANESLEKQASNKKLSEEEREYLEGRVEFYEDVEWLAKNWDFLKPLKDYADISRKVRRELGLE